MRLFCTCFCSLLIGLAGQAQTALSLPDCEARFRQTNLQLLAEQFNISTSQALVIQARIWELPFATADVNLINPERGKVFDVGGQGQKAISVQQLVYMGGKKRKEVAYYQANTGVARLEYEQLLRTLLLQLRTAFYNIHFSQLKIDNLSRQLANVDSLVNAFQKQAQLGNVPLKEVVRLQSLSIRFRGDIAEIRNSQIADQQTLKVLTNSDTDILPQVSDIDLDQRLSKPVLTDEASLTATALGKNPDYLLLKKTEASRAAFLDWQKSLSVPDLLLGTSYDQRSGAFNNQVNVSVGLPLRLWNRNRGNILAAESDLKQVNPLQEQKAREIRAALSAALAQLNQYQQLYTSGTTRLRDFEIVYNGLIINFRKQNVSLLEFTDFMESYNESVRYVNEIKRQIIISQETINNISNENIY